MDQIQASAPRVWAALADLCTAAGIAAKAATASGSDPVLPTPYRIGTAGAAVHLAVGLAAADLSRLRGGAPQVVSVGVPAAVASLRANHYLTIDGTRPKPHGDRLSGFYRVKDGRSVYLHCNFPNLRDRAAAVLGVPAERAAMERACAEWDGEALETALHDGGACGSFTRTAAEWQAHPHYPFVAQMPVLEITRIGDAPPEALPPGDRPLAGIRALDLTRVIAGPACGRALAEHGAEVLKVSRPDLPDSGILDIDSGVGKLSTYLDVRVPEQAEQLKALVRDGDVFLQSYRPGALASHGFGAEDLAAMRPGIVVATLSAWGHEGPWRNRRGYDTVVQSATGIADRTGGPGQPAVLPVSALDYIAGNLLTLGIMAALARRATEGGSWRVRVSLVTTQHWLVGLGLVDAAALEAVPPGLPADVTAPFMMSVASTEGAVGYLGPVLAMSGTPLRADRPPVRLGTHPPEWPTR
ncbi:CoA transferase [Humitalea sp. 24SJ18S-53]|uniref:CoA transferase n=1 Tax=Humitalea sp. 24SJ18S-53 TaxID=3422307 RepID=UPI003D6647CD